MKKSLLLSTALILIIGLILVVLNFLNGYLSIHNQYVPLSYQTERVPLAKLDSPAIWHGPQGENWILVTAIQSDKILLYDLVTGDPVNNPDISNLNSGVLDRPNGIAESVK